MNDVDKPLPTHQQRMIDLLRLLAPLEGYNLSPLPHVRFLRSDRPLNRTPVLYDPGIVIVCQGRKTGYWGNEQIVYDAQHYLAVSVPVPFDMETAASAAEPLLAIYMHLDFDCAAELLLQLAEHDVPLRAGPKSLLASPFDEAFSEAVVRFLQAMAHPVEASILGPGLMREIYFRVLTGAQGGTMRAALNLSGQFGKIARAVRTIHTCYPERLDVTQLAAMAGMSIPAFHAHFREVTNTSPMQYLKTIRLHQARLLMCRNGMNAEQAGSTVGYESSSQFNREFKRLFGLSPVAERTRLAGTFNLPPPMPDAVFVSSH